MSSTKSPSIETFPVEILHRIFDNLDTETILYSIRSLSRLFQSVVNTYNQYILNLNLISKSNFYLFCRLIPPANIISLTLSNDERTLNQIDLFISLVHLEQITRLRSLTLLQINETQLNFFLKHINLKTLISLSCHIKGYDDRSRKTTAGFLPSTIEQTTLRQLKLDTCFKITDMPCPINGVTEYLSTRNRINIDDLCKILQCSPYLHTLMINGVPVGILDNLTSTCFRQLTSLTIKNVSVTIDELESFLLLIPSLVYLKLIGGINMLHGERWERFIQRNLSQLNKFEFYFTQSRSARQTLRDLKIILDSFKTSFWIEHKKWFIICEYENYLLKVNIICLYSIPICTSYMHYTSKSTKTSLFSYSTMINKDIPTLNNIKSLTLTLDKSTANDIQEKCTTACHPLFPEVTEVDLQFHVDWPLISLGSLFVFIDFSRIVHIKMSNISLNGYNHNLIMNIEMFLKQLHNLFSLSIHSNSDKYKSDVTLQSVYSILPRQVKHLTIPIDDFNQINIILRRCKDLSFIQFDIDNTKLSKQIIAWFTDNTINTTCQTCNKMVAVWLGRKTIQSTEICTVRKRIKLADNT